MRRDEAGAGSTRPSRPRSTGRDVPDEAKEGVFDGRRLLVVFNPSSGRGRPEAAEAAIRKALDKLDASYELRRTGAAEDAGTWAAAAGKEGFDVVLAAGGDGTVAAVARGLLEADDNVPLGVVPLGTGNGLARVLGLPMDTAGAIAALHKGAFARIDVVDVSEPPGTALLFLGAGLDADINRDADGPSKARFGFLAYIAATVRNLVRLRSRRVTLHLDGVEHEVFAHTVTIFNAGRLALGGVQLGPDTDPHDGLLDVAVLRSANFWRSLAGVLRLSTRAGSRDLLDRAREVRIDAFPPLAVHFDGDVAGTTPLVARVLPGALQVLAAVDYRADHVAANDEADDAAEDEADDEADDEATLAGQDDPETTRVAVP